MVPGRVFPTAFGDNNLVVTQSLGVSDEGGIAFISELVTFTLGRELAFPFLCDVVIYDCLVVRRRILM